MMMIGALAGCGPAGSQTRRLAKEITYYDWEGDMPQSVLDRFTQEHRVKVNYVSFESMEEAVQNLAEGKAYDVVNMDPVFMPSLLDRNLLAELDRSALTNFKNLSENFRDLTYDPGNRYSIPNSWGAYGISCRATKSLPRSLAGAICGIRDSPAKSRCGGVSSATRSA